VSLIDMAGRIMRSLGVGGEKPQVSREQAFQARPVRNPELKWRVNDEECIEVVIPRRRDRMGRIMGWLFAVPESRPVALDEVGTHIWGLCDGEHTVGDLMDALCEEYNLGRREVEVSLTEYLRMLGKRGMIAFMVPEDEEAEPEDVAELDEAAPDAASGEEPAEEDPGEDSEEADEEPA